jgi:hypothetical protein
VRTTKKMEEKYLGPFKMTLSWSQSYKISVKINCIYKLCLNKIFGTTEI